MVHIVVEAAQLFVYRGGSGKTFSDDGVGAQHDEQVPKRRAQVVVRPSYRTCTGAAGQVSVEKSLDHVLVDPMDIQTAPDRPVREVCKACQVATDSAGRIPALRQMTRESINVGRQLALKKPICRIAVKSCRRVHCGLLEW